MKIRLVALLCLLAARPAWGQPLEPRAEGNLRYGSERSIFMSEIWIPLSQNEDGVLYGDLRLMGDDGDNREGNLGLGYREFADLPLIGTGVAGLHGWIDRRVTDRGSQFYQATAGAEWLGSILDLRVNGYAGLTDERTSGGASVLGDPYFAGSGLLVTQTTQGGVIEETLDGFDAEIGLRLPFMDDFTDSTRIYAGGFHFAGERSEDVTGWRARLVSDITPDIQLGTRFQRDDERGSQGFLEATIRFPFGHKQSFRASGLRARLDESPERDIDIVTGENAAPPSPPRAVEIINTRSSQTQRVLHVDNSAGAGGDGTLASPFSSLSVAAGAAGEEDIIYVHAGDGTAAGQDQGIVLNKNGQQLVSDARDFVMEGGRYGITDGGGISRPLVIRGSGGALPRITNTAPGADAVRIAADRVTVQGFEISGADRYGIMVSADGIGASAEDTIIRQNLIAGNASGLYIEARNGGRASVAVQNNALVGNDLHGASIYDDATGALEVDLGGGALGSRGLNILSGNGMEDLSLDYGGRVLNARGNWWGQAGGPVAGQIFSGAQVSEGLVAHWQLDEASGGAAASRGGNHPGSLISGAAFDPAGGYNKGALDFNSASADRLSIPDFAEADTGDKLTLSYWINPDSTAPHATHIAKWDYWNAGSDSSWAVRADNSGGELLIFIASPMDYGDNFFTTSDMDLTAGDWTNISIVYDGAGATNADRLKVYKNGVQVNGSFTGTISSSLHDSSQSVSFGDMLVSNPAFADYYDGKADNIRLYNSALDADQIGKLYRSRDDSTAEAGGALGAAPAH